MEALSVASLSLLSTAASACQGNVGRACIARHERTQKLQKPYLVSLKRHAELGSACLCGLCCNLLPRQAP